MIPSAGPVDAYRLVREGAVLLDVREGYEHRAGHAPDALHIPLGRLAVDHRLLPRGERIVVICRSGNRSADATAMLRKLGYEAFNVAGGMGAWQGAGLPVTTPQGAPGLVA